MIPYKAMTREQLLEEYGAQKKAFDAYKAMGLKLDMSRGKPGAEQLALSMELLNMPLTVEDCTQEGDARNYGMLEGLPACRRLFAELLGVKPEQVFIGGVASLNLMYDLISKAYTHGLFASPRPWRCEEKVKFLCPSPGYDRHFAVTESFGAELITVKMTPTGPDMDEVERLALDPQVKGIWCVPKYSNPDGVIYSEETVRRLASMNTGAPDFVIMWDNAYCVHEFDGDFVPFADMLTLCREAGNPNRIFEFASTSKITFPGAGISCMAANDDNMKYMLKLISKQIISHDKLNQLRHVKYFGDKAGVLKHMKRHAAVLAPKFNAVLEVLERELGGLGIGEWLSPKGGYFVSFNAMEGCASRANALCREAGVIMTGAGATYPYGRDPLDSNLRIAPSLPPIGELRLAMEVFCVCMKLAALEKLTK